MDLSGRVAIVTGGAAGIGYAIAARLLRDGASVLIFDLDNATATTAATELAARYGDSVTSRQGSVIVAEELEAAFDHAESVFGPVDILVNNAGFSTMSPLVDMPEEDWTNVLSVLTTGPFLGTKILARRVIARGGSADVVNTSSLNGTAATDGLAHYCTAKAGVNMFTQVAASELGRHGIRVNAVAPGLIKTGLTESHGMTTGLHGERFLERTPLGRLGEPDDVARVVAFLVSADSGWITGQTIATDGGNHIRGLHSYWDTSQQANS